MLRLAVRVAPAAAELVLAELLELVPAGVEESGSADDGYIEYAIYGAAGELPDIGSIEVAAGAGLVELAATEVADDWADRWRAFHRPVTVCGRLHLRPPWEPPPRPELIDVVIDPGQAFGTGAHATTRLCLELLCAAPRCGAAVDLGCGSGVLAIAAARLGHGPVLGLDHERQSVAATVENAAVNGVAELVSARRFDLLRDGPSPTAPLVLANLLRPLLLCVARVGWDGPPPQTLIASGLLEHESDEVACAFASHGLHAVSRLNSEGWAALLLERR